MATINKIKGTDNNTYDLEVDWSNVTSKPSYNESNISAIQYQNGTNYLRMPPKVSTVRANRLAFLPADQIIIEQTTDGGATWVSAGITDDLKRHLFAETRGYSLPLPKINNTRSKLCGLRITITAMKYDVPAGTAETQKYSYWNSTKVKSTERYCDLEDMYFWVNAIDDRIGVKVEGATGANSNTWTTLFDVPTWGMTGWSGSDCIKIQGLFGGLTSQTTQLWNYRMTFMTVPESGKTELTGGTYATAAQTIMEIRGYGSNIWTVPNEYASNDKLYTIDINKNATFPANVKATSFNGNPLNQSTSLLANQNLLFSNGNNKVSVGIGAGGVNRGLYDDTSAQWMIYSNSNNQVIMNGKATTAGTADTANSVAWANVSGKPTIPSAVTETTVSGWGFTKNAGTITSIKMNGASKGTSGEVDLGTVITAHQDISGKQDKITSSNKLDYSLISGTPTIPSVTGKLDKDGGIATNLIMSGAYRDDYYASNVCRHFYGGTPTEFVIKTKIKFVSAQHMPLIRIYGYAYGLQSPIELRVGFYIYNDTLGWAGASSTGAWKPEIYLFRYTENNVNYVALGLKGSCYFCGFQVDAQIGASGAFNDNFKIDGWSTTHNGANTAVTLIPAVNTDKCVQVEYKTMKTDINGHATTAGTANVANSVLWGNVSGRPTKISELTNDSGFTSNAGTVTSVAVKMNNTVKGTVTSNGTIDLGTVITEHQSLDAYTPTANLADVALNGEYGSLLNLPVVPTVVSELPNDAGYLDSTSFITTGGQTIVDSGALVSYSTSWNVASNGNATNAYTFYLEVIETSVNTDAKTSAVTYKVYAKGNNNYSYNGFSDPTVTIKVDGTSLGAVQVNKISTTKTLIATKSNTVTHNADGTKTISVTVQYANSATSYLPKPHTSSAYSVTLSTFTETEGVDIAGIRTPNGKVYNLADTYAREQIENIANVGYTMLTATNLVGRKWDNGFLEYWIVKSIGQGAYTAWQSHYYRNVNASITYPTPFTTALGTVVNYDNPTAYASQAYPSQLTSTQNVRLMTFTNQSSLTGNLYMYVWGYWK